MCTPTLPVACAFRARVEMPITDSSQLCLAEAALHGERYIYIESACKMHAATSFTPSQIWKGKSWAVGFGLLFRRLGRPNRPSA